jgi:AraC-like DNA-binding protein
MDTRGIVDPARMLSLVDFHRYPVGESLDGLVAWFWAVSWALPDGVEHTQEVLGHPGANMSVGTTDDAGASREHPRGRVYGATTGMSRRHLVGTGWTVAALTTTGGLGAFVPYAVHRLTDRAAALEMVGLPGDSLVAVATAAASEGERGGLLRVALESAVEGADPARVAAAREVAAIAGLAEHDREVRKVSDLARAAGFGVRTLQRLFAEHVGISPLQVVRRWRILEAAEAAAAGSPVDWAGLAAALGYSDQPHLVRDFTRQLGVSPAAYLRRQRALADAGSER